MRTILMYGMFIILTLNFSGCIYYGYSLELKEVKVKYKAANHFSNTDKKQFYTNVFNKEGIEININNFSYDQGTSMYQSYIEFELLYKGKDVKFELKEVEITHLTIDSKVILASEVIYPEKKVIVVNESTQYFRDYLRKYYSRNIKDKTLREKFKIVFLINGVQYIIEDSFNIYRKYEYNYFDILMSV